MGTLFRRVTPYKAGIPKGTDTAGNQAGNSHRHNRAVGAECRGCRKAGATYGCKNEPESDILNWVVITQQIKT